MNRIHIVGRKNTGKTTLVVELVKTIRQRGITVGTIKHTHHTYELDQPGKDSYQHRQAGGSPAAFISGQSTAVFLDTKTSQTAYQKLEKLYSDCDIVIVEGDSHSGFPTVEVYHKESTDSLIATENKSILAIISDDAVDTDLPVWPRADIEELVNRILELSGYKFE